MEQLNARFSPRTRRSSDPKTSGRTLRQTPVAAVATDEEGDRHIDESAPRSQRHWSRPRQPTGASLNTWLNECTSGG